MIEELCFGVIPCRQNRTDWELLLVQHKEGHWGFPKGHSEEEEKPLATAKRELKEETGLYIQKILSPEPFFETYQFQKRGETVHKKVGYYLASVTGILSLQEEELQAFVWLSARDSQRQVSFVEAKNLCEKIIEFFNKNNSLL